MARKPTEGQLKALRNIQRIEEGQQTALNLAHAEECEDFGWAEAQPGGGYRLTNQGRRILRESPKEKDHSHDTLLITVLSVCPRPKRVENHFPHRAEFDPTAPVAQYDRECRSAWLS